MGDWNAEADAFRKYLVPNGINVEVGCGCRKIDPQVIGVDPITRGNPANMNLPSVADLIGTGSTLHEHFKPESIDFICAGHSVHYEPDLILMFKKWQELLKPNGIIAVIDLHESQWQQPGWNQQKHCGTIYGWQYFWRTQSQTQSDMEVAGYKIIESRMVCEDWSYIVVGQKNV